MIARVACEPIAFGKTYTGGTDGSFMAQDAYVRLIGSVLGHEPIIVHVPKELLAAARVPEITDGIYSNVTRFDLAFAFDQFSADFPDFRWGADLADPIRAYVARLEAEGAFRETPTRGIDDALIDSWEEASAVFASVAV